MATNFLHLDFTYLQPSRGWQPFAADLKVELEKHVGKNVDRSNNLRVNSLILWISKHDDL